MPDLAGPARAVGRRQRVAWRPVTGANPCAADPAYTATVTAINDGPLRFATLDLDRRDTGESHGHAVTLSVAGVAHIAAKACIPTMPACIRHVPHHRDGDACLRSD